ncbi:hypothetical protein AB0F81_34570 [Actinoplanes sp. NPDC024001]|uniref:hypothetical protein n=1 Tax=Actinoplanes sp. NPDC024001 TaxID=3154598 RepID=UPI003405A443
MNQQDQWRSRWATRIIGEYHAAGNAFDGLYQSMLPHLHSNRNSDPQPGQTDALLATVQRVTRGAFPVSPVPWPHLVLDAGVISSYAKLDNPTVGVILAEAVADSDCRIVVSPLAYLRTAVELHGTRPFGRLLRLLDGQAGPDGEPLVDVPAFDGDHVPALTALAVDDRPDVAHTAMLALPYRCVIATTDPGAYHRLGYLRTIDPTRA